MMCVQGGDLTSLQELMLRYEKGLYSFLARYTGDGHLAEDLFQDCFLRVVQKRETFDSARGFRPWLYSVAANLARDACRRREVRSRDVNRERLVSRKAPPRPDEEAERLEEAEMVRAVVAELPGDARTMVLLHFYQGLTYREVAESLGVPVGTVKSRMHWAVARLARRWNERAASGAAAGRNHG
jgi:RNA polymerase sigma-70 factor (ECF subfamily)